MVKALRTNEYDLEYYLNVIQTNWKAEVLSVHRVQGYPPKRSDFIIIYKESEAESIDYQRAVEDTEYCERHEPTYNPDDGSM